MKLPLSWTRLFLALNLMWSAILLGVNVWGFASEPSTPDAELIAMIPAFVISFVLWIPPLNAVVVRARASGGHAGDITTLLQDAPALLRGASYVAFIYALVLLVGFDLGGLAHAQGSVLQASAVGFLFSTFGAAVLWGADRRGSANHR